MGRAAKAVKRLESITVAKMSPACPPLGALQITGGLAQDGKDHANGAHCTSSMAIASKTPEDHRKRL